MIISGKRGCICNSWLGVRVCVWCGVNFFTVLWLTYVLLK